MNTNKEILREEDVVSGSESLDSLFTIKSFPVFIGCTNEPQEKDKKLDMCWHISRDTGIIQLNPVLPLNLIYQEEHGSGSIGSVWLQHHQQFARFIQKENPRSVLEIGGGHGILSKEYSQYVDIDWTIIEPNPSPISDVKAKFIKGFFDEKFSFNVTIDTVIHSHVFEHVYYPDKFIGNISKFLNEGQKLIFSLPNLESMLKKRYTNCLNFEHTVFLTEPYIDHLLSKHGFKKLDKQYFLEDHSIFYSYVKDSKTKEIKIPNNLYDYNKKLYLDYIDYHETIIKNLNLRIKEINQKKPIYLFGAHIFSQHLIAFGLDTSQIICLLDNDPNKHGKRLYGTNLKVESPEVLKDIENPIIILKAAAYNEEIRNDILENINSNTNFWE